MNVVIRPATPDDAEAVLRLAAAARQAAYKQLIPKERYGDFAERLAISPKNIEVWRKRIERALVNKDGTVLVLVTDGKIAGFYSARVIEDTLHIKNLYIDPTLQGKGLGKRLLAHGMQATPRPHAMLHVLADNKPAIAFYERQGFAVDGEPASDFFGAKRLTMTK